MLRWTYLHSSVQPSQSEFRICLNFEKIPQNIIVSKRHFPNNQKRSRNKMRIEADQTLCKTSGWRFATNIFFSKIWLSSMRHVWRLVFVCIHSKNTQTHKHTTHGNGRTFLAKIPVLFFTKFKPFFFCQFVHHFCNTNKKEYLTPNKSARIPIITTTILTKSGESTEINNF